MVDTPTEKGETITTADENLLISYNTRRTKWGFTVSPWQQEVYLGECQDSPLVINNLKISTMPQESQVAGTIHRC